MVANRRQPAARSTSAEYNELVDGRIAQQRVYYDQTVLLSQLGLMPA